MNIISLTTVFYTADAAPSAPTAPAAKTIYDIPVKTIDGKATTLTEYKGKVMLIVNTASKCGYTPQYKGLQALYEKYKDKGLVVLGFPSNDFLFQEPGDNTEIKKFCELKYKVTFPMFEKGKVKGEPQPLYAYLLEHEKSWPEIKWNFEKFLINRKGEIVGRFKSSVTPESTEVTQAVEKALI